MTKSLESSLVLSGGASTRQSNFEILRIIAMFFVLVHHANFRANGEPLYNDFVISPISTWFATFIESLSIVAVNVFVMISGWFGIKPSLRGFCNFIFQCIYMYGIVYIFSIIWGWTEFSFSGLLTVFCLTEKTGWFIKAYIALYILSPLLNLFLEKVSKKELLYFLVCFYLYQTIYGIKYGVSYLVGGYSPISFIGLYIFSGFLRRYGSLSQKIWGGYIAFSILISLEFYICKKYHLAISPYQYLNPLVVLSSAGLIMWTEKFKINYNNKINFISKSVFAIYLFHVCPLMPEFYLDISRILFKEFYGVEYFILISVLIIVTFTIGILLDQPRKWIWNNIISKLIYKTSQINLS